MQQNDREWSSTRSCQSKLVFQDIFSTLTTEQKARVIGWPHRAQAERRAMRVMSFQKCGQSFDSDGVHHNSIVSRWRSSCRAIAHMESPCAARSAATMMRVRVSLFRAYSGLSDCYGDNARSCCLSISLACCSGVSD